MGQHDQVVAHKQKKGMNPGPSIQALNVDLNTRISQSQELDNISDAETVDKSATRQDRHDRLNVSPRGPRKCNLDNIIILQQQTQSRKETRANEHEVGEALPSGEEFIPITNNKAQRINKLINLRNP